MPNDFTLFGFRVPGKSGNAPNSTGEGTQSGASREPPSETVDPTNPPASSDEVYYDLESSEPAESQNKEAALHQVLKGTDIWFGFQLSQLEKFAVSKAEEFARAGLPRIDVDATEELAIETVLRRRAERVFLDWAGLVRRKLKDRINRAIDGARTALLQLDELVGFAEGEAAATANAETTEESAGEGGKKLERIIEFESSLPRWMYFLLLGLLVGIDWIANVPVFRELLPQDPGSARIWQTIVERSEKLGLFSGIVRTVWRAFFFPEAAVLALGVIVFLMFLAHVFGTNLRRIVALRGNDERLVGTRRSQAWVALTLASLAIPLVVVFLFLSRGQIERSAQGHLTEANRQVLSLQQEELEKASQHDEEGAKEARLRLAAAKLETQQREQDLDYASRINSMNFPILMLNIVLVLAAATGAYLEHAERIRAPHLLEMDLGDKEVGVEARIRGARQTFESDIGRAKYLGAGTPFANWQSKKQALEAVIPQFRSENSLKRGIDVQNIKGFLKLVPLALTDINADEQMGVPDQVAELERYYENLGKRLGAISKQQSFR